MNENEPYYQMTGSHIGKHNKETTLLINVACPSESKKTTKREEKKVSKVMLKTARAMGKIYSVKDSNSY